MSVEYSIQIEVIIEKYLCNDEKRQIKTKTRESGVIDLQWLIERFRRYFLYTPSALCFGYPARAEQKHDAVTQRSVTQKNVAQEKRLESISILEKRRVSGHGLMKT